MSNYLVNHNKKRQILARLESELLRTLERGDSDEKARAAAEEVRAARIRVLHVERSRLLPKDGPHAFRFKQIADKIDECLSIPVETIVEQYRRKLPPQATPDGMDEV